MANYLFQGAPIPLVAEVGQAISLADILEQQFGLTLGGYTEFYVAYEGTAFLELPTPPEKFSYWDPANPSLTTWNLAGTPIGETTPDQTAIWNPIVQIPGQNVLHVTAANLDQVTLVAGNVILPSTFILVPTHYNSVGAPTAFTQYTIATVQGDQLYSPTASEGAPTPFDVVTAAVRYDALHHGVANNDDCHFIAQDVAAAAGATMNDQTQYGDPSQNVSGGFWRVVYRGSDPNPVSDWQTLVEPGDIVRMGWSGGGDHTTTVLSTNADGSITVFDNCDWVGNNSYINIHTVNYDELTDPSTITIYRLSPDNLYQINGEYGDETLVGTVYDDEINSAGDGSALRGGPGDDVLYGVDGGWDQAVYSGNRSDYAVSNLANGAVEVIDLRPGSPDGTDTDFDISILQFADGAAIIGTALDDRLTGAEGNDRLAGFDGQDRLVGQVGRDQLRGGSGRDALTGGLDRDILAGGADGDLFVYLSPEESLTGARRRDQIRDFEQGLDRIDLSRIDAQPGEVGDQAFSWLGTSRFTDSAGELRFWRQAGETVILADLDGDARADFTIALTGFFNLESSDFRL